MLFYKWYVRAMGYLMVTVVWIAYMPDAFHGLYEVLGAPDGLKIDADEAIMATTLAYFVPIFGITAMLMAVGGVLLLVVHRISDLLAGKLDQQLIDRDERMLQQAGEDIKKALDGRYDFQQLLQFRARLERLVLEENDEAEAYKRMLDERISAVRRQEQAARFDELKSHLADALPDIDDQFVLRRNSADELSAIEQERRA